MIELPPDDAHRWPRWAARGSLASAFVCFAMNCVFMQLTRRQLPSETDLANQLVGWGSLGVLIAGVVAGVAAIVGATGDRNRETLALAALGLLLNGGVIGVMLWLLNQISSVQP